jgi:hypothetical protein
MAGERRGGAIAPHNHRSLHFRRSNVLRIAFAGTPCPPHSPATGTPPSACRRIAMI